MTKLTLTISDPSLIEEAKTYAKATGRSVSALVENYLKTLTRKPSNRNKHARKATPLVDSLIGIGGKAPDKSDKELLMERLNEKYDQ